MTKLNISLETDGLTTNQSTKLVDFLHSLADETISVNGVKILEATDSTEEKPKATRNRSKKVETTEEAPIPTAEEQTEIYKIETVAEEVAPEEEDDLMGDEATEPTAPTVTREMVRSKVSDKQAAHKDAIRAKLKDLGAENVTKLEDKHFGDFYAFLNKLA